MNPEVQSLVAAHAPHLHNLDDGRVKCTLNGHIMPATLVAVNAFTGGAKFQRLKRRADEEAGFVKYEPFIIQSKNVLEKLYCALTCMLVNKSTDSLRKHMKGKAFLAAKGKFEADELELMEEPDFEESEASQSGEEGQEGAEAGDGLEDMEVDMEADDMDNGDDQDIPRVCNGAAAQCQKPISDSSKLAAGGRSGKPAGRRKPAGKQGGEKKKKEESKLGAAAGAVAGPVNVLKVSNGPANAVKGSKRVRAGGSRPKKVKRGI